MLIRFSILSFLLTPFYLYSFNGYISVDHSATEKDWDFMPSITNSFKSSDSSKGEIYMEISNFGIKLTETNFFLELERSSEPKKLDLNANSSNIELLYLFDNKNKSISLNIGRQEADDQFIDCYSFSSVIIGSCDDARLSISNSKEKYDPLNDTSIMMISGSNESIKLNFNSIKGLFNLYDYDVFFSFTKNDFNWLTPVEEIILNKGFIYNLGFQGRKLGELIEESLSILPQRDNWNTMTIGLESSTYYNIFNDTYLLIEPTLIFVHQDGYSQISEIPNYNVRLKTSIVYAKTNFQMSVYGSIYKNNLYGFENITFNQRSEHHFSSKYGNIGLEVKYLF